MTSEGRMGSQKENEKLIVQAIHLGMLTGCGLPSFHDATLSE